MDILTAIYYNRKIMKVERISTYERFVASKGEWNTLLLSSDQNLPFLTHQWFDAWWQSFGQDGDLEILFFWDDSDSLAGVAPLMISGEKLGFMASHEVTDYCDFIFCENKRDELYEHLLNHLGSDSSKYYPAELINIPESSPSLSRLPELAAKHGLTHEIQESEVAPVLTLPGSYEEYLQNLGRKSRHELRRKSRKWDSVDDVCIEKITDSEKIDSVIEQFVNLHKASSPAKQEFWIKKGMKDFFTQLVHLFSKENWVGLDALYIKDRLIAALLSFSYGDTLYFYNVTYDLEYSAYSPGFHLFDQAIKQGITEGKKKADFLRGQEKYKYFFGAEESKIYNFKLIHRK
jgi:CelD/BcsL family acetyltransferase involved in cellulose biosynthesis